MNSELIKLISISYSKNKYGIDEITETATEVFAKVETVSAREFFNAGQSGIKPEYKLTVNADEYNSEEVIQIGENRYSVYRIYRALENTIELYVERKAGTDGNTT